MLFALELGEYQGELRAMIERGYKGPGDVERAMKMVKSSGGIARSKELALHHSALAIESANMFGQSPARDALIQLAKMVVSRSA